MVRTHVRGQQPHGVRRLLPRTRHRTRRATGTAHVHPHARRATGATGARTEERPTMKTTARHASGTTTRRMTHERARSSPMRGSGRAQLARRRTPRIQEESLDGSIAYGATRPVRERRVMATTRLFRVFESTHGAYTWPRTEINQRTNQATNQPVCAVNKDNDVGSKKEKMYQCMTTSFFFIVSSYVSVLHRDQFRCLFNLLLSRIGHCAKYCNAS